MARRDGTVLADAWLPDLVRLGELERHLGDGVTGDLVGTALEKGRLKPLQRRRIMSYPLVIELMIAMTMMPDASCCEALSRLAGLLADIPFMLVNLADTPANWAFFGSTGTADGSSPFPQLRIVAVTARAGRARLGAILSQTAAGEQTLLKRLVKRRRSCAPAARACLHTLNLPDGTGTQNARRKHARIPARHRDQDHHHRKPKVTVFAPGFY